MAACDVDLPVSVEPGRIVIQLPDGALNPVNSIVVLEIKEEPEVPEIPSKGKTVTASSSQEEHLPRNVLDGTEKHVWKAEEGSLSGWLELDLDCPIEISGMAFDEPSVWPRMKQNFQLAALVDGEWKTIISGKTIGHGHTEDFQTITARRFRLEMDRELVPPEVAEWQLYAPE